MTSSPLLGQTTKLEMAHVLFMDIVSYSKMDLDHQKAVLGPLQSVVCATPEFLQAQASQEMIRLPTGDGMALVFFGDAEAAARCALEITKALESHPEIPLRMGLHSGPIYRVADINAMLRCPESAAEAEPLASTSISGPQNGKAPVRTRVSLQRLYGYGKNTSQKQADDNKRDCTTRKP